MKDFVLLLAAASACAAFLAEPARATLVTVTPDSTNRITVVAADSTRANTVFTNFSTWQSDSGTANTQRTMQLTSTATFLTALETALGPLGSGQSYLINSAILTVGGEADNYTDMATAHQLLVTYNPATVTWNTFNNGGVAGTEYVATASATSVAGTNSATWDLTSVVQGWVNGGTNKGLYFKSVGYTTGASTFTTITGTWTLDAEIAAAPANELQLVDYQLIPGGGTFTWTSSPGKTYRITGSLDLLGFPHVAASGIAASGGATTSHSFTVPPAMSGSAKGFYRVEEE